MLNLKSFEVNRVLKGDDFDSPEHPLSAFTSRTELTQKKDFSPVFSRVSQEPTEEEQKKKRLSHWQAVPMDATAIAAAIDNGK
jgi:hypothetical protein